MFELDMRGKACPIPMIEAKKKMDGMAVGEQLLVRVDNHAAVQNLKKLAEQTEAGITDETLSATDYKVTFTVNKAAGTAREVDINCDMGQAAPAAPAYRVVVLSSKTMGTGADALGETLMKGYVYAITQLDPLPDTILMYNTGAYLSIEGAETLADLRALEEKGVEILTCGTCLNFYEMTDKLAVGGICNMYNIAEKLNRATHIIRP